MHSDRTTSAAGELLVDHVSAYGPAVTHIRGILLMNAISNLALTLAELRGDVDAVEQQDGQHHAER